MGSEAAGLAGGGGLGGGLRGGLGGGGRGPNPTVSTYRPAGLGRSAAARPSCGVMVLPQPM